MKSFFACYEEKPSQEEEIQFLIEEIESYLTTAKSWRNKAAFILAVFFMVRQLLSENSILDMNCNVGYRCIPTFSAMLNLSVYAFLIGITALLQHLSKINEDKTINEFIDHREKNLSVIINLKTLGSIKAANVIIDKVLKDDDCKELKEDKYSTYPQIMQFLETDPKGKNVYEKLSAEEKNELNKIKEDINNLPSSCAIEINKEKKELKKLKEFIKKFDIKGEEKTRDVVSKLKSKLIEDSLSLTPKLS